MKNKQHLPLFSLLVKGLWPTLFALLLLDLVGGLSPIVVSWTNAKLIDALAYVQKGGLSFLGVGDQVYAMLAILSLVCMLLSEISDTIHGLCADYFKDLVYRRMQYLTLEKIAAYPTGRLLEDPILSNKVALAKRTAGLVSEYATIVSHVLMGIFTVIPALALAFSIKWWIPVLLIIAIVPFMCYKATIETRSWSVRQHDA